MSPSTLYPSLVLVLDSEHARWFHVDQDTFKEIASVLDQHDRYTDHEGKFSQSSPGSAINQGTPEVSNSRAAEHIREHLDHVASKTKELWQRGEYKHLFCVEPDRYKNMLKDELEKALPPIDIRVISGNHGHDTPQALHKLFLAHRGGPEE